MPRRRRNSGERRRPADSAAEARAREVAAALGRGLKDARRARHKTQAEASAVARVSQSTWSAAERAEGTDYTMATWTRMARAVGSDLNAYLSGASAADQPRDAAHLRNQELVIRTAEPGGWQGTFEATIGDPLRGARSADILLTRDFEIAVIEVFDWLDDFGAAIRSWDRKLAHVEARALARPQDDADAMRLRVSGCWVLRATRRNRELVSNHPAIFRARFPASGRAWLRALTDRTAPMPVQPGLLWVSVRGERLWPARP